MAGSGKNGPDTQALYRGVNYRQGFGEFYKPAELWLNQVLAELPKLSAEVNFLKVNKLSAADVLHKSNSLHNRWPKMEGSEKRKIVEAIIEKVVFGNGKIDINYSHLPTSIEQCKNQQRLGTGRGRSLN